MPSEHQLVAKLLSEFANSPKCVPRGCAGRRRSLPRRYQCVALRRRLWRPQAVRRRRVDVSGSACRRFRSRMRTRSRTRRLPHPAGATGLAAAASLAPRLPALEARFAPVLPPQPVRRPLLPQAPQHRGSDGFGRLPPRAPHRIRRLRLARFRFRRADELVPHTRRRARVPFVPRCSRPAAPGRAPSPDSLWFFVSACREDRDPRVRPCCNSSESSASARR